MNLEGLRFGEVKEIFSGEHSVIVIDNITKIETPKLMVLTSTVGTGQGFGLPPVGAQIAFFMFGHRQGLVLGGVLTDTSWLDGDPNIKYFRVSDTRIMSFNTSNGELIVETDKIILKSGTVEAGQNPTEFLVMFGPLSTAWSDLLTYLGTGTAGGDPVAFSGVFPNISSASTSDTKAS